MARTKRTNKSKIKTDVTPILNGISYIYKCEASGDVWQFRMYIRTDKQHFRQSLRTRDFESAKARAVDKSMELSSMVRQDVKVFGVTLDELIKEYLEYRMNDVVIGDIVIGRHSAMRSQLRNLVRIKSGDTKLSELDRDCLFDYYQTRKLENPRVTKVTIRNEQATINAMFKYAYRKSHIPFEKLNFRKIKINKDEVGRRDTFTLEEYERLIKFMRQYVSKKHCPDDEERLERLIIRDVVLISSNTCCRVGEIRQMRWMDILDYRTKQDSKGNDVELVKIRVRKETSKVRQEREIITRGAEYFKRLSKNTQYKDDDDYIFTFNGNKDEHDKTITDRKWSKHWYALMDGIGLGHNGETMIDKEGEEVEIESHRLRKLEWYSLRHFGIGMRVASGVPLVDIAKMTATSVTHITDTYLHYTDAMSESASVKNFSISEDGIIDSF